MRFVKTTVGSPLGERIEPLGIKMLSIFLLLYFIFFLLFKTFVFLEIGIHCSQCGYELKGAKACPCKYKGIKCSICNLTVRGISSFD
jgi:hypothetical protein